MVENVFKINQALNFEMNLVGMEEKSDNFGYLIISHLGILLIAAIVIVLLIGLTFGLKFLAKKYQL